MRSADVPSIALESILLEPLSEDDVDALYEIARNPASIEDYQYAAEAPEAVALWVEASLDGGEYAWTIRPKKDPDAIVGMVAVEPENEHVGEAGYFVDEAFTRRGFATQALTAATDWVLENTGLHRIKVGVTRGNEASRRVAEKSGYVFEGVSRKDWLWKGVWHDSINYSRLSDDTAPGPLDRGEGGGRIVEVTTQNLQDVLRINVAHDQRGFVAPNCVSIAQAHFEPGAWYRAVADVSGAIVGFVMVSDPSIQGATIDGSTPTDGAYLWRLMVAEGEQGKGYGRTAVLAAADYSRRRGFGKLYVSACDGPGGPIPFYEKLGFRKTGRIVDEEVELVVQVEPNGA